jgi:hypothetical protein
MEIFQVGVTANMVRTGNLEEYDIHSYSAISEALLDS